jgi:hypothetical protein
LFFPFQFPSFFKGCCSVRSIAGEEEEEEEEAQAVLLIR